MKTEEIIEGNKLIAEFEQLKYYPETANHGIADNTYQHGIHLFHPEKLQYHSSWDWLMPVVEKIEDIVGHQIIIERASLDGKYYKYYFVEDNSYKYSNNKLIGYYQAVVNFIKYYNNPN